MQTVEWVFRVIDKPVFQECNELLDMVHKVFGPEGENIYFFKLLAEFGRICATYEEDKPICVAQLIRSWNNSSIAQIISFAVLLEYQNRGVGSFTVRKILDYLRSEGVKIVGIKIPVKNNAMFKIFCEKFDFRVADYLLNCYGPNKDRFYLEKRLEDMEDKGC